MLRYKLRRMSQVSLTSLAGNWGTEAKASSESRKATWTGLEGEMKFLSVVSSWMGLKHPSPRSSVSEMGDGCYARRSRTVSDDASEYFADSQPIFGVG